MALIKAIIHVVFGIMMCNKWYIAGRYMPQGEEERFISMISNAYKIYQDTQDTLIKLKAMQMFFQHML